MAARRPHGRRFGTLFVLLGIVAIIGTTFTAGFLAGRHWERVRVVAGLVKPQAGKEPHRERAGALRPEQPSVPSMTFYQELTAPLASPPPRPARGDGRPARPEPPKAEPGRVDVPMRTELAKAEPARTEAPRSDAVNAEPTAPASVSRPDPESRRGYTVQVAAYATRAQADTLAGQLRSRGFETDVSEATTQGGVRYRVRVGTYPTRDAARDVVARLSSDARLSGFVTVR